MKTPDWVNEFDGAVTICDKAFTIVYMNERSKQNFKKFGGGDLIGKNLLECHNEESNKVIRKIMIDGITNSYTLKKKDGRLKAIIQTPWFEKGKILGVVEVMFDVN